MKHATVDRDGMTVIGVEVRTSNQAVGDIKETWTRFYDEDLGSKIPQRADDKIVAVYCEYDSDHKGPYTFLLGCAVDPDAEAPDGMVRRAIDGGTFAYVPAEGPQPETLVNAWTAIWEMGLDRRYDADYEIHYPTDERVEIYVGVNA